MTTYEEATARVRAAFDKWLRPLGLLWWHIDVRYYDDPAEVSSRFGQGDNMIVAARTTADWRYMEAGIDINLHAFVGMEAEAVERAIVHECLHILVNETRENDIDHEERVVTTLTKAVFWIAEENSPA